MIMIAKIILAGDGGVGKTSLRRTFMGEKFNGKYLITIGADFSVKTIHLSNLNREIKFQIWDLAGQPRFQEVRSVYYTGLNGVILIYDLTRPDSFENIPKWLIEIKKQTKNQPVPVILLANKVDLKDKSDHVIKTSEGKALAKAISKYYWNENKQVDIPFFETSAVTGLNIDEAFNKLGELIMYNQKSGQMDQISATQ